jgi:hypothetical protein
VSNTGPSTFVMFENDLPEGAFTVTVGGEPADLHNYAPELHLVDPDGAHWATLPLTQISLGVLGIDYGAIEDFGAIYQEISDLERAVGYTAQIFLQAVAFAEDEIGLFDVVEPYWSEYIPSITHIPLWNSGELRVNQTVLTEFPWDVRESFRLRGATNG